MKRKFLVLAVAVLVAICAVSLVACNTPATETKTLDSILITTEPSKTVYTVGEKFDPTDMVVAAKYSDSSTEIVTDYIYKTDALTIDDTKVTVSYTKSGTTRTADVAITVNPVAVTDAQIPMFSGQPQGATLSIGAAYDLTVTVTVADSGVLSYQWYSNTVNSATGGTAINGATSKTYTVPTENEGTIYYYVVVTNTNDGVNGEKIATATSETAVVIVNNLENAQVPKIIKQPIGATITVGAVHTLSVTASVTDGGDLSYQWYSNNVNSATGGTAINGATSKTYAVPTETAGTVYYRCVVANTITDNGDGGNKVAVFSSDIAEVKVNAAVSAATPMFVMHGAGIPLSVGETYAISVMATVADGGTLSYQWYKNTTDSTNGGILINGATDAKFSVPTNVAGTVYYYVVATNTLGTGKASATNNVIKITVREPMQSLPEKVATIIQGIDSLPVISQLSYQNNAVMVKYLMAEYSKLSAEDKALVTNYAYLQAANAKINELAANREVDVDYSYSGEYPENFDANNPLRYKSSDGQVVLRDPFFSNDNDIEFIEWRENNTQTPVTTLADAFALMGDGDSIIRLYAVFGDVQEFVTVRFVDANGGATLYEDTVPNDYGWYYFSIVSDEIVAESGRYPFSYDCNGQIDQINIVDVPAGEIFTVTVKTVAMRSLTFPAENKYDWSLSYYFDGEIDGENVYISGSVMGDVTSCLLPVGVDVTIDKQNADVTEILIDGVDKLQGGNNVFFTLEAGVPMSVTFTKTTATKALVIFTPEGAYNSPPPYIAEFDAASWDGKLTQSNFIELESRYPDDDWVRYVYAIDGVEYLRSELGDMVFSKDAGDMTVIAVRGESNHFALTIWAANGTTAADMYIFGTKTLEYAIQTSDSRWCEFILDNFDLYTDETCTTLFAENIQTFIPNDYITLYMAVKPTFTISFDTTGGNSLSQIQITTVANLYDFELIAPVRVGYNFVGWALTNGGTPYEGETFDLLMTHYNKDVTLFAVWQETTNMSEAALLGLWECADGGDGHSWYMQFNADGSGRIVVVDKNYALHSDIYTNFIYEENGDTLNITAQGVTYIYSLSEILTDDVLMFDGIGRWNEYVKSSVSFIDVFVVAGQYDGENKSYLLPNNLKISDFGVYGYDAVYYLNKAYADTDKTFEQLADENGGELILMRIRSEYVTGDMRFIDLDLGGGSVSGVPFVPVNENRGAIFGEMPVAEKGGYLFTGWYTADGDKVNQNNITELLRTQPGEITLYARYIDGSAVNYAGQAFVGTWSERRFYESSFSEYVLILNADGTYVYSYTGVHSNGEHTENFAGIYRFIDGEIVIITGDNSNRIGAVDARFANDNILGATLSTLTKGTVVPANYTGEAFLGEYEIYYSVENSDYNGYQRQIVTLNADGTFLMTRNSGEYSDVLRGFYRVVNDELVFIGNGKTIGPMLQFAHRGAENFSGEAILGEWVAVSGDMAEQVIPALNFDADGTVTFSRMPLGINVTGDLSTSYVETEDGYKALVPSYGNSAALRVTQDGDTLTAVLYDYLSGEEVATLHYVRK